MCNFHLMGAFLLDGKIKSKNGREIFLLVVKVAAWFQLNFSVATFQWGWVILLALYCWSFFFSRILHNKGAEALQVLRCAYHQLHGHEGLQGRVWHHIHLPGQPGRVRQYLVRAATVTGDRMYPSTFTQAWQRTAHLDVHSFRSAHVQWVTSYFAAFAGSHAKTDERVQKLE